jgi:hypothetical protein
LFQLIEKAGKTLWLSSFSFLVNAMKITEYWQCSLP